MLAECRGICSIGGDSVVDRGIPAVESVDGVSVGRLGGSNALIHGCGIIGCPAAVELSTVIVDECSSGNVVALSIGHSLVPVPSVVSFGILLEIVAIALDLSGDLAVVRVVCQSGRPTEGLRDD